MLLSVRPFITGLLQTVATTKRPRVQPSDNTKQTSAYLLLDKMSKTAELNDTVLSIWK